MVLEQVAVAALDLHKMTVAEDCLVMLSKQFPGSQRVRKLKALRLEALERSARTEATGRDEEGYGRRGRSGRDRAREVFVGLAGFSFKCFSNCSLVM